MKIFSIKDTKAEAYLRPFFAANAAVAIRDLERAMTDPQSGLSHYPEDFILFEIGYFDELVGEIEPETPKSICKLIDLKREPDPALVSERVTQLRQAIGEPQDAEDPSPNESVG